MDASDLDLRLAKFQQVTEISGILIVYGLQQTETKFGNIEVKDGITVSSQQSGPDNMDLMHERIQSTGLGIKTPFTVFSEVISPVRMGKHIGNGYVKQPSDDAAQSIGNDVIQIIETMPADQLNVFNQKRGQETDGDDTSGNIAAEPVKNVRQQIAHGNKHADVHVDLGKALRIPDLYVFHGPGKAAGKKDFNETEKSQVYPDGFAQILKQSYVQQIVIRCRAGKEGNIADRPQVNTEHDDQQYLADMQQSVSIRIGADAVRKTHTQFSADEMIKPGQHENHDYCQYCYHDVDFQTCKHVFTPSKLMKII